MANYLDTLLSKIDDGNLKSALSSEIQSLRDAKKFGLVFERHIPERVRLLNHPITPGVFVTLRKEQGQDRWLVKTVSGDVASLERDDGTELFETEMFVRMFETQAEWGESQESKAEVFRQFAADLGLNLLEYDAAVEAPETLERVRADFEDGIALGVESTPTFFLNDRPLQLTSFDDLRAAIEAELQR